MAMNEWRTTADHMDEEPPPIPVVNEVKRSTETDGWGTWDYRVITFESNDDAKYYRTEHADNPDFDKTF